MRKPEKPQPSQSRRNTLRICAAVATAAFLLAIFAGPIEDTDFWWHLKTGQYIAQQHRLPFPDPFSYTSATDATARFNLTHEWLSQVLLYLVYSIGGFPAVVLARAVLLALICGLAGSLSGRFWTGIAAACATASVLVAFTADRPTVVTFLGIAVFVSILETRRFLWWLPPIALLWANCHGGFFLGWIVLLAYALRDRRLWPVFACTIAASLINPNGFAVLKTLAAYRKSPMTASLIEWQRPKLWGRPYGFDLLLFATAGALVISWRRVRIPHWLLFVAFAAAALMAFRNLPLVGFLAPVLIARYALTRLAAPTPGPDRRDGRALLARARSGGCGVAGSYRGGRLPRGPPLRSKALQHLRAGRVLDLAR